MKNLNPLLEGKYTRELLKKTAKQAPELAAELKLNGILKKGSQLRKDIAAELRKAMTDGGELSQARQAAEVLQAMGDHSGDELLRRLARGGQQDSMFRRILGNADIHRDSVSSVVKNAGREYIPGERITKTVVDDTIANKIRKWLGRKQTTSEVPVGWSAGTYKYPNPNYYFTRSSSELPQMT